MTSNDKAEQLAIRRARITDAPRLAELAGQLGYPSTTEQIRRRFRALLPASQNTVFVAESPSEGVVGWVHVSKEPLLDVDVRAEINGLVVAEGKRSLGAGAMLMAAAEDWARKRGCKGMNVRSNVIRERAHQFYLRCGFEHYKTQKSFRKFF